MCGIVGFVGKKNAISILVDGLTSLEYRGYDSSGIAYFNKNQIEIIKEKGKLENLIHLLPNTHSNIGIGHTRWATHGKPDKKNAHPHQKGKITLVHNGIIENYQELKKLLPYDYQSETDTEVIAALLDKLYQESSDKLSVLQKVKELLRGSYALGILFSDDPKHIYAIRKDSPLILAHSTIGSFIASDVPAILKYTNQFLLLENNEIAVLENNKITVYNDQFHLVNKDYQTFEGDYESACKAGYEHFMLKEIHEQPKVIQKTLLGSKLPNLTKYNSIHIVACGSAYHAGLIGKQMIEQYASIPVTVTVASEYRYQKNFYNDKTLVIFISQSGETADTLACLRKVNDDQIDTLGIVNVVGSSLAREASQVIYTKAGCEIAVATTKAYSAQIALLSLLALNKEKILQEEIYQNIIKLPSKMEEVLLKDYQNIAKKLYQHKDIFFIGRGIDYYLALEGSLKLKEISYLHSEAYPAGELKHGTISLIEEGTPVIAISTNKDLNEKIISNCKEVKARGAKVIYIVTEELNTEADFYDEKIVIPTVFSAFQPLITILPLQMIAYEVAKLNHCDIDKPKNLAKSVTVE